MTEFESFKRIPDFPGYMISSNGQVYNTEFARWMTHSPTGGGDQTVGLWRDGKQYRRSVKVLVARAFVDGETGLFDTPIQMDNDKENLRADNLAWRPRWFAWQYTRQFSNLQPWTYSGPLRNVETGDRFDTVIDAAMGTGSLIRDIRKSLLHHTPVFPHGTHFEYIY